MCGFDLQLTDLAEESLRPSSFGHYCSFHAHEVSDILHVTEHQCVVLACQLDFSPVILVSDQRLANALSSTLAVGCGVMELSSWCVTAVVIRKLD